MTFEELYPLFVLAVGILIVIGMIVGMRINAFIALITAAIVVSLMAPGEWADKITRVAAAFGNTAAGVGIVIAMAAVIGKAMMDSGAADRVVRAFLDMLGEKRGGGALMGSGFVLAIPVFFDTVFFLLVPLARSMYRRVGRNYLKFIMAISAGGAITHTLVPPTPGPLIIADQLGVDLGTMMIVGVIVAIPAGLAGLAFAHWRDKVAPVEMRPAADGAPEPEPIEDERLPGLGLSLLPILLPVILISANTAVSTMIDVREAADRDPGAWAAAANWTGVLGNPNLALVLAAAVAVGIFWRQRRPTRQQMTAAVETALMSGGLIILITAAGGAFGGMLQAAEIGPAIQGLFGGVAPAGILLLFLAFLIASLLKIAQGSSTVAMIAASAMIAAMIVDVDLGFHPVYLATAIGTGSLVGSWMNDSGFWIYTKMGGVTEVESLTSWTPLLAILGITGMIMTTILALVVPMA